MHSGGRGSNSCSSVDDDGEEASGDENSEDAAAEGNDVEMDVEPKPSADPNDLSAFKMEDYDKEESKGAGMPAFWL